MSQLLCLVYRKAEAKKKSIDKIPKMLGGDLRQK